MTTYHSKPRICADCWTVVLEFINTWMTVVSLDNALADFVFHQLAISKRENLLSHLFGRKGYGDMICVGMKTNNMDLVSKTDCIYIRDRNACKAVYFVWNFCRNDIRSMSPSELYDFDFERCKKTRAIKRPTRVVHTVNTRLRAQNQRLQRIHKMFKDVPRLVKHHNPQCLLSVILIPPRMRRRHRIEFLISILKRMVKECQRQLRVIKNRRDNGNNWYALRHMRVWLERFQIDINKI